MVSRIPTNEDDSEEEDGSNVILVKAPTMNFQPEKSMDGNGFPPEKSMDGKAPEN